MPYQAIVKLDTIMDGTLSEKFQQELPKLLQNVYDPETSAKAKRSMVITISIVPSPDRKAADLASMSRQSLPPRYP